MPSFTRGRRFGSWTGDGSARRGPTADSPRWGGGAKQDVSGTTTTTPTSSQQQHPKRRTREVILPKTATTAPASTSANRPKAASTRNFFDPAFSSIEDVEDEVIYSDTDCTPHGIMTPTPNGSDYAKSRHFLRFRCSSAVEQVEEANEATATSATRQKLLHKQDEQGMFFNLQKNSVLPGAHQSGDDGDGVAEMGGDANGAAAGGTSSSSSSTLALRAELLKADQLYESFVSRVRCFGVHHFSVAICLEELGKKMNSAALAKLEAGNVVEARTLLLLAEKQMHAIGKQFYDHLKNAAVVPRQTDNFEKNSDHRNNRRPRRTFRQAFALFASLTLNNLASLERGRGGGKDVKENGVDEHEVQKDLEKALAYLEASKMWVPELPAADAAVTYLNLSAVLSELGRHKEAEKAAMNAVRRSEQDIMCLHRTTPQEYGEKVASLAVAYNNWAVQKELLASTSASTTTTTPSPAAACCPEEATSLYQKALHLANNHLEEGHPLRHKFQQSVTAVLARNLELRGQTQAPSKTDAGTFSQQEVDAWLKDHAPEVVDAPEVVAADEVDATPSAPADDAGEEDDAVVAEEQEDAGAADDLQDEAPPDREGAAWMSRVLHSRVRQNRLEEAAAVVNGQAEAAQILLRLPIEKVDKEMTQLTTPLPSPVPMERATPHIESSCTSESSTLAYSAVVPIMATGTAGATAAPASTSNSSSPITTSWAALRGPANKPVVVPRLAFAEQHRNDSKPTTSSSDDNSVSTGMVDQVDGSSSSSSALDEHSASIPTSVFPPSNTANYAPAGFPNFQKGGSSSSTSVQPLPRLSRSGLMGSLGTPKGGDAGRAGRSEDINSALSTPLQLASCRTETSSVASRATVLPSLRMPTVGTTAGGTHHAQKEVLVEQSVLLSARSTTSCVSRRRVPNSPLTLVGDRDVVRSAGRRKGPSPLLVLSREQEQRKSTGAVLGGIFLGDDDRDQEHAEANEKDVLDRDGQRHLDHQNRKEIEKDESPSPLVDDAAPPVDVVPDPANRPDVDGEDAADVNEDPPSDVEEAAERPSARRRTESAARRRTAAAARIAVWWTAARPARHRFHRYLAAKSRRERRGKCGAVSQWRSRATFQVQRRQRAAATLLQARWRAVVARKSAAALRDARNEARRRKKQDELEASRRRIEALELAKREAEEKQRESHRLETERARTRKLTALCEKAHARVVLAEKRCAVQKFLYFSKEKKQCADFISLFIWCRLKVKLPRADRNRKASRIQALFRGNSLRKRLLAEADYLHLASAVRGGQAPKRTIVVVRRKFKSREWRVELVDYDKALLGSSSTKRAPSSSASGSAAPFTSPLNRRNQAPTAIVLLQEDELLSVLQKEQHQQKEEIPCARKFPGLFAKQVAELLFPAERVLNLCAVGSSMRQHQIDDKGSRLLVGADSLAPSRAASHSLSQSEDQPEAVPSADYWEQLSYAKSETQAETVAAQEANSSVTSAAAPSPPSAPVRAEVQEQGQASATPAATPPPLKRQTAAAAPPSTPPLVVQLDECEALQRGSTLNHGSARKVSKEKPAGFLPPPTKELRTPTPSPSRVDALPDILSSSSTSSSKAKRGGAHCDQSESGRKLKRLPSTGSSDRKRRDLFSSPGGGSSSSHEAGEDRRENLYDYPISGMEQQDHAGASTSESDRPQHVRAQSKDQVEHLQQQGDPQNASPEGRALTSGGQSGRADSEEGATAGTTPGPLNGGSSLASMDMAAWSDLMGEVWEYEQEIGASTSDQGSKPDHIEFEEAVVPRGPVGEERQLLQKTSSIEWQDEPIVVPEPEDMLVESRTTSHVPQRTNAQDIKPPAAPKQQQQQQQYQGNRNNPSPAASTAVEFDVDDDKTDLEASPAPAALVAPRCTALAREERDELLDAVDAADAGDVDAPDAATRAEVDDDVSFTFCERGPPDKTRQAPSGSGGGQKMVYTFADDAPQDGPDTVRPTTTSSGASTTTIPLLPWTCAECDFLNEVSPDMCVMCDSLRPVAVAGERNPSVFAGKMVAGGMGGAWGQRGGQRTRTRPTSAGSSGPSKKGRTFIAKPPEPAPANSIAKRKRAAAKGATVALTREALSSNGAGFSSSSRPASALTRSSMGGTSNTATAFSRPVSAVSRQSPTGGGSGGGQTQGCSSGAGTKKVSYQDPRPFASLLR